MSFNLDKIRADTPATESILHFNNAGASLMPQPVYDGLRNYLDLEQKIGGYEAAAQCLRDVEFFYTAIARLLNASPLEIAYVENATRAWDMAVYAIPFEPGDEVLLHESEYSSNYLALLQLSRTKGINLKQVPSDEEGQIDCGKLEILITPRTKAIFLTHVPSHGGLINPAEHVGMIARRHDLIYVLDACQSVGQMPVDVNAIGCDITCGTGRKFLRGPRGTGFLYVSERVLSRLEPPFVDLHAAAWSDTHAYSLRADAKRFETYERFVGGQIALAKAAEYALDIGLETIGTRVQSLARLLRERLKSLDSVTVRDQGLRTSGIVTFEVQGSNALDIVAFLRAKNINTSAVKVEHARLDLENRGISTLVRASVHYYLTEADIEAFTSAISDFAARLENIRV